jgi:hypothetical protein
VKRLTDERKIVARQDASAIVVDAAAAGGVELRFIP